MNLLRERAGARDSPPWLDIYDDDLEAALAQYEVIPDAQKRPAD